MTEVEAATEVLKSIAADPMFNAKTVDAAIQVLAGAIKREASPPYTSDMITSFMGLTPDQIQKLINFYEGRTGNHAWDI